MIKEIILVDDYSDDREYLSSTFCNMMLQQHITCMCMILNVRLVNLTALLRNLTYRTVDNLRSLSQEVPKKKEK